MCEVKCSKEGLDQKEEDSRVENVVNELYTKYEEDFKFRTKIHKWRFHEEKLTYVFDKELVEDYTKLKEELKEAANVHDGFEFPTDEYKGTDDHINSFPFWKRISDETYLCAMKGEQNEDVSYLEKRMLTCI